MDKFKVGDLAIIDFPYDNHNSTKLNGTVCEILSNPYYSKVIDCDNKIGIIYGYEVKYNNFYDFIAERDLRKLPPKQQTTTWESCAWRPEGVTS